MTSKRALGLIAVLAALASCVTIKELDVATPLAPMLQPEIQPGTPRSRSSTARR